MVKCMESSEKLMREGRAQCRGVPSLLKNDSVGQLTCGCSASDSSESAWARTQPTSAVLEWSEAESLLTKEEEDEEGMAEGGAAEKDGHAANGYWQD